MADTLHIPYNLLENNDPWIYLRNVILWVAAYDYDRAIRYIRDNPDGARLGHYFTIIFECEDFFRFVSKTHGERIIKHIREGRFKSDYTEEDTAL